MQDIQPKHWGGEWKLSPFYSMVVIDNPFSQKPGDRYYSKEICVARNGFRPLPDITRDRENMCRIVVCVNYCNRVSNQDLLVYKYLRYVLKDFERDVLYDHSPTPWIISNIDTTDIISQVKNSNNFYDKEYVVYRETGFHIDSYINEVTSERIVLCVNFCEGYTNEELLGSGNLYNILHGEEEIY